MTIGEYLTSYIDLIFELEDENEHDEFFLHAKGESMEGQQIPRMLSNGAEGDGNANLSVSPRLPKRPSSQPVNVLPGALASLRPASLPGPSLVRPIHRSQTSRLSSSRVQEESIALRNMRDKQGQNASSRLSAMPMQIGPYDEEMRRLVGADMPIHRGSWSNNRDIWHRFQRGGANSPAIAEEIEDATNLESSSSEH